jgi:hypothetical protein
MGDGDPFPLKQTVKGNIGSLLKKGKPKAKKAKKARKKK